MARARRAREPSPPPPEEAQNDQELEEEDEQDEGQMDDSGTRKLKFDEALTWRPGKTIAVSVLLRRLEKLCKELQSLEQELVDRESVTPKAQELASKLLLDHKDSGVKAWTMLCIVETFRLLAPDAPVRPGQLKDIFTLFVRTIVPTLARPSDPYNSQNMNTLESLASFKSILLIGDIPGSERLMLELFGNCFDVLESSRRGDDEEQLSKNVGFNMTALLTALIDEATSVPSGLAEIILAQFLRVDMVGFAGSKKPDMHSDQGMHEVPEAYRMAKSICNTCEDKMVRHIGQYFNSVLIDANEAVATASKARRSSGKKRSRDESDDESDDGLPTPPSSELDLGEVEKAHRLLRELWKSCPEVIRNVVPQIEAEVGAENLPLRIMAVQTVGDMISGIGAAGPPAPVVMDPAAYPSLSLEGSMLHRQNDVLITPAAPHAFSSAYPSTYQAFFDRHRDKAAPVRSAWTTAVGRVLSTSGGGKGLDREQETQLQRGFADMLLDNDEKVRLAAVQAIAQFDFDLIIQKLGNLGGVTTENSILHNFANRIKDPKPSVRTVAIELAARIWGVSADAIAQGRDRVRDLLGALPSRIFDAMYLNNASVNSVVMRVLYESLLPVGFPPIKSKTANYSDSQRVVDSQSAETTSLDPDTIRAERLLVLVRDLDDRAKVVFFSYQNRQKKNAQYIEEMLKLSERLQSNPDDANDKKHLQTLLEAMASWFPDVSVALGHLLSFFKHYDRRNYSLTRFCISPESDYRKVVNALKELTKRLEQAPAHVANCLETVSLFLRMSSYLIYNRSHVPGIMTISRSDGEGLTSAAHEVLKKISHDAPQIFKVHIKDLCESLKKQAPTATENNSATAVDSLKACAGFARQFPGELGQDRDFYKAMEKFALHGMPASAAKHAVTVIVSSADKKEMYIKSILQSSTKNFQVGDSQSLPKLAALSQLRLRASEHVDDQEEAITEIATRVLAGSSGNASDMNVDYTAIRDIELDGKLWALKTLINDLRGRVAGLAEGEALSTERHDLATKVFRLLNTLIEREGELSSSDDTPEQHRSQLRLAAAKFILKLCCNKSLDRIFSAQDFNRLIRIVQDPLADVRAGFIVSLKKYLTQGRLHRRFYALTFLYAFEPDKSTKKNTETFLKARVANFARNGDQTLQSGFAFLLSLLAHHQDFAANAEDLEDFVDYIIFYLKIVASEKNLPQIYSIAQRVKSVQDKIDRAKSENLYVLSDLSETVMRHFAELQGWSLQILPGRAKLPSGLFDPMDSHSAAQEIAARRFLPEELVESLDDIVRDRMRTKKRKSAEGNSGRASKKARSSTSTLVKSERPRKTQKALKATRPVKTPRASKKAGISDPGIPSSAVSERRKSARTSNAKSYAENDDSEDDEELEQWQDVAGETDKESGTEADAEENGDVGANKENEDERASSTPPTSDPVPAAMAASTQRTGKPTRAVARTGKKKTSLATSTTKAKTRKLPSRGTRSRAAEQKDSDVMPIPSDTDGEQLSEPPSDLEA